MQTLNICVQILHFSADVKLVITARWDLAPRQMQGPNTAGWWLYAAMWLYAAGVSEELNVIKNNARSCMSSNNNHVVNSPSAWDAAPLLTS